MGEAIIQSRRDIMITHETAGTEAGKLSFGSLCKTAAVEAILFMASGFTLPMWPIVFLDAHHGNHPHRVGNHGRANATGWRREARDEAQSAPGEQDG
jgi:hypothetical protein